MVLKWWSILQHWMHNSISSAVQEKCKSKVTRRKRYWRNFIKRLCKIQRCMCLLRKSSFLFNEHWVILISTEWNDSTQRLSFRVWGCSCRDQQAGQQLRTAQALRSSVFQCNRTKQQFKFPYFNSKLRFPIQSASPLQPVFTKWLWGEQITNQARSNTWRWTIHHSPYCFHGTRIEC